MIEESNFGNREYLPFYYIKIIFFLKIHEKINKKSRKS